MPFMQDLTTVAAALLVALTASPAVAAAASGADQAIARDALELHYLDEGIYDPVECRREQDEGDRTWMFCTAVGGSGEIGGLYLIEAGPVIWAVNGKAIQHIGKSGGSISSLDLTPIKAEKWTGEGLDISAALALFD